MKSKNKIVLIVMLIILLIVCSIFLENEKSENIIQTSDNTVLSIKKEWGIKRGKNGEQPDLGSTNRELIEKYNGMAMGNKESKKIYITFDLGYEAGYTTKILDVLKDNNVSAAFFITAHYVNTASNLVQRMIEEGHIIGNQFPTMVMYHI